MEQRMQVNVNISENKEIIVRDIVLFRIDCVVQFTAVGVNAMRKH